jgi:archaellum component FlaC
MGMEEGAKMELEKKPIIKTKWFPWVVGAVAVLVIFFGSFVIGRGVGYSQGHADEKAKIDGQMITYDQLVDKIKQVEKEFNDKTDKLNQVRSDFASYENKYNELKDLQSKENDMKTYVSSSQSQLETLKEQINDAQSKLATLQGDVVTANGSPIKLGAGHFTVGEDLNAGRYKVEPVSGYGNFIVNGGDIAVTLDSAGDTGTVKSYVFDASDGDTIELDVTAKFTPVE